MEFVFRVSQAQNTQIEHGSMLFFAEDIENIIPLPYIFPLVIFMVPVGALLVLEYLFRINIVGFDEGMVGNAKLVLFGLFSVGAPNIAVKILEKAKNLGFAEGRASG